MTYDSKPEGLGGAEPAPVVCGRANRTPRVIMTRLRKLNLAALAALLASSPCSAAAEVGPPPDATSIEMAGGNGQAAQVGTPLPIRSRCW